MFSLLFFVSVYFINVNRSFSLKIASYKDLIISSSLLSLVVLLSSLNSVYVILTGYASNLVFNSLLTVYLVPFLFIFVFITFLSIIFCLSYNKNEFFVFVFYCYLILFIGFNLFLSDEIIYFFLLYEMLLVPSFFILYKFAKTRRAVEAAYLMFFWTQFGAILLIFSFFYLFILSGSTSLSIINSFIFSSFDSNLLFSLWLLGFGVKFPIWPFYGWLPKAHVEASTNFSIFLSGVLVKFAFFAFFKCFSLINFESSLLWVQPLLIIGIVDSSFKISYQIDLKKIVAYSTVIEMHWLTLSILTGSSPLFLAGFCMLVSHAFLSTNFFYIVDFINKRFKTRLITEVNSLGLLMPKLFILLLANLLIFLGFPGSLFFIAEFLFFAFLLDFSIETCLLLIFLLYLLVPTFFFKSWWSITSGSSTYLNKTLREDLNSQEILLISSLTAILFWLGFSWQLFLF